MYIKSQHRKGVLEKNLQEFKKLKIDYLSSRVDPTLNEKPLDLARFESALEQIKSHGYTEGQKLSDNDLIKLSNEAGVFISALTVQLEKNGTNRLFKDLTCATDYLYSLAMDKLGSVDIPAAFGPETKSQLTTFITGNRVKSEIHQDYRYAENVYENQRGKDADEVLSDIGDAMSAAQDGRATPKQVQELSAAYKALHKRQSDHGFFWRLFHSDENNNRTELLSNMESALRKMVGNNASLLNTTSRFFAEQTMKNCVKADLETAFSPVEICARSGVSVDCVVDTDAKPQITTETQSLRGTLISDLNTESTALSHSQQPHQPQQPNLHTQNNKAK